jgi:hypothetical protein
MFNALNTAYLMSDLISRFYIWCMDELIRKELTVVARFYTTVIRKRVRLRQIVIRSRVDPQPPKIWLSSQICGRQDLMP